MPVVLATVASNVTTLLNASGDPRWTSGQITEAVLAADALVCAAIFFGNNPHIVDFYAVQSGVVHGGVILATAGRIISVKFVVTGGTAPGSRAGTSWEKAEIEAEIRSALALDYDPHFAFDDRVIWHNGAAIAARSGGGTVSVNVTFPSYTRTSACQSPSEYEYIVFCGAMSLLVGVEGENAGIKGTWGQEFAEGIKMVEAGETPQQAAA
jgi:hypothetical protein